MVDEDWKRTLAHWHGVVERRLVGQKEPPEDPELLLQQAQEEMRAVHARNRERAVQAITRKNSLQQKVDDTRRKIGELHGRELRAKSWGEHEKAAQYHDEADRYAETLEASEASLTEAIEAAEAVKTAIKAEEARIRQRTGEALVLRSQWKLARIEQTISRCLDEIKASVLETSPGKIHVAYERNRAALTEAICLRNELKQIVKDTVQKVVLLEDKAELARQRGDEEFGHQLQQEREQYEAILLTTRDALGRAEVMTNQATLLSNEQEAWLADLPPTSD
jgi:phage shock protein A